MIFLPPFFEFLFARAAVDLQVDLLAQLLRTNLLGADNFDFIDQRTGLEDDDQLDAVTLGFGENPDVLHRARLVKSARMSSSASDSEYGWPAFIRSCATTRSLETVAGPTY